jgi:hypothetical protein
MGGLYGEAEIDGSIHGVGEYYFLFFEVLYIDCFVCQNSLISIDANIAMAI